MALVVNRYKNKKKEERVSVMGSLQEMQPILDLVDELEQPDDMPFDSARAWALNDSYAVEWLMTARLVNANKLHRQGQVDRQLAKKVIPLLFADGWIDGKGHVTDKGIEELQLVQEMGDV